MLSDREILNLLETNPDRGLKKLSQAYGGLVYVIVRGKLSALLSEQDVEECVCDVLFEAYEKRGNIRLTGGTLKGYLAITAKSRATDRFRKATRGVQTFSLDDGTAPEPETGEDMQCSAELTEVQNVLLQAIESLGHPDNEILIRKYYFTQRSREIAKALGMKENTVDQRARRGLERLRKNEILLRSIGDDLYEK